MGIDMAQKAKTPKAVVQDIGREYVEMNTLPGEGSRHVATEYARLAQTVRGLYSEIPVPVVFQKADPYDDYQDMAETVGEEGVLRVYSQHADHPVMSEEDNLRFRAVHDWHGHLKHDVDFSPAGEFLKWYAMRDDFTDAGQRILFAEVVGQVGAVHYLPDGFSDERYVQRAAKAPTSWIDDMTEVVFA